MKVLHAMNVNQALSEGLYYLRGEGVLEKSRNGDVVVSPVPVTTVYQFPRERVLFSPVRDANPFFHLMESLWMLAGRNDIGFPCFFNGKFEKYSDDGKTFHGAYGHRWLRAFGDLTPSESRNNESIIRGEIHPSMNQLKKIGQELRRDPTSRRCVLQMWSAPLDLPLATGKEQGKDVPCNTHAYFLVNNGNLDMTVCCRSNDIVWGAYGANAVHMSIMMEYVAVIVGVPVGCYRQISNNYHAYVSLFGSDWEENMRAMGADAARADEYIDGIEPSVVVEDAAKFDADISEFFKAWDARATGSLMEINLDYFSTKFFRDCALPMFASWFFRKAKAGDGLNELEPMKADHEDWYIACREWIIRREEAKKAKVKVDELTVG